MHAIVPSPLVPALLLSCLPLGVANAGPQDDARARSVVQHELGESHVFAAADWSAIIETGSIEVSGPEGTGSLLLAPASIHRDGWRIELEYGKNHSSEGRITRGVAPGVTEILEASSEAFELSYLFDSRPPGSGDLVVRIDVASEMVAELGLAPLDGLSFRGRHGELHIGSVIGIDASGVQAQGELHWDGRQLSLSLPAAFVDQASYPLLLDPPVAPARPMTVATNDRFPDLAFDANSGIWGHIWVRRFSFSNRLLLFQRTDFGGAPLGAPFVLGTASQFTRPSVANCGDTGHFLFSYLIGGGGVTDEVLVGSVRAIDGAYDPLQNIGVSGLATMESQDLGGDFGELAMLAIAFDTGDVDLRKLKVDPSGQVLETGVVPLHMGSSFFGFGRAVRISNTNGEAGHWAVAWETTGRGFDPDLTSCAMVARDGAPIYGPTDLEFDPAWVYRDVACASSGNEFLFSFVRDDPVSPDEVWVHRLSYIGGGIFSTGQLLLGTSSSAGTISGTDLDHARSGVSICWRDRTSGVDKIVVTSVDALTVSSCESTFSIQAGSLGEPRAYAMASSGLSAEDKILGLIWSGDPTGPTPGGVQAAQWESCP